MILVLFYIGSQRKFWSIKISEWNCFSTFNFITKLSIKYEARIETFSDMQNVKILPLVCNYTGILIKDAIYQKEDINQKEVSRFQERDPNIVERQRKFRGWIKNEKKSWSEQDRRLLERGLEREILEILDNLIHWSMWKIIFRGCLKMG